VPRRRPAAPAGHGVEVDLVAVAVLAGVRPPLHVASPAHGGHRPSRDLPDMAQHLPRAADMKKRAQSMSTKHDPKEENPGSSRLSLALWLRPATLLHQRL
jgi:hypothetical protein